MFLHLGLTAQPDSQKKQLFQQPSNPNIPPLLLYTILMDQEGELRVGNQESNPVKALPVLDQCRANELGPEHSLTTILTDFHQHLTERATHFLGYHINQECNQYLDLSPFLSFHINNVGDPFNETNLGLHSRRFELGVLEWFAHLWKLEKDEYWGYVTNGGTEGNLHGLLLGRELLPDGILYASDDSHYSIFKAARMYRMDCKHIASLTTGEIDCRDLKIKLLMNKDKPAIINVNIGTTFKGAIDDIDLVLKTLAECGFPQNRYYVHCDAALYGLVVPFLNQVLNFNFKKPIGSMCVSGYKFLSAPMTCGVLMTRKSHVDVLRTNIEYLETLDTTMSGGRNGHAPLFMWYGLSMKGDKRIGEDVKMCLRNAQYLKDRLRNLAISCMLNENSIIVVFERPLDHEFIRHWQLSCVGNMAHVVVMPHVTIQILDDFVTDFIEKRKVWSCFGDVQVQPPCLAKDIGDSNCFCQLHHKN